MKRATLLAVTLGLFSFTVAQKVATPIEIGVAVAQTSNVALLGQEQVIGARLAEKFFNNQGGINGTPIKLVFQDTGGDEAGAINAFQNLIRDGVVGIVGPTLSQHAFAADPIAERAKVPVLGPSNTAKGIPQIGDFIARVSAPVAVVAPNAVKQALKLDPDIKRVAVLYAQNDAFSVSETGTFQETAKAQKLDVVTVQKFQTTDTDFTTQVTAVLGAKVDLVIISGLAADGGNLVKQLRQLGYKGLIIGGNGLNTSNIFSVCGRDCDGILIAQAYSPQQSGAINQVFVKEYRAQYKKDPPQFAAQAYTGVQVFVEALRKIDRKKKLNTWDLDDLRAELNKAILVGSYRTPLGVISFDKEGELNQKEFYVAQIKMKDARNGSFVFLK
ncbi:ABC transporter substrate-binding protein [Deinococcus yavapaiensis]|uniref:Amino acid/amide ABC transporter substrate-binding protein (HAAT family) n=1 Tax=Deinococcus yavapaiensis KR-236 TaxID=694435 RepID=A0A318S9F8_9DEIO|nr:ABC transporter substrate-binding protein [Deinococcus yavapaiensis]PYE55851.1 amino acid/amide ABC transporter substrate-binding protein (HAAT family) [Deinococcus yavapaiensis KR-236]